MKTINLKLIALAFTITFLGHGALRSMEGPAPVPVKAEPVESVDGITTSMLDTIKGATDALNTLGTAIEAFKAAKSKGSPSIDSKNSLEAVILAAKNGMSADKMATDVSTIKGRIKTALGETLAAGDQIVYDMAKIVFRDCYNSLIDLQKQLIRKYAEADGLTSEGLARRAWSGVKRVVSGARGLFTARAEQ